MAGKRSQFENIEAILYCQYKMALNLQETDFKNDKQETFTQTKYSER